MLAGQEGLASAIPLSREYRGFHSMTLRPGASSGTYRVSVAYDVAVQRHVETIVTLHSGIQVYADFPLALMNLRCRASSMMQSEDWVVKSLHERGVRPCTPSQTSRTSVL